MSLDYKLNYPAHHRAVFMPFIICCLLVFILPAAAFARDVSLSWTANNDNPPVDGYRLYYKTGDPGQTLNDYTGTDAAGGNPSPIDLAGQSTTSYIVRNLLDNQTYSFVLTAYRGTEESSPTTALTSAGSNSSNTRNVSFAWTANTDTPPVDGYRLYYKTGDPGQTLNDYIATDAAGGNPSPVNIAGQNITAYAMQNLLSDQKYSFVLTAYRGNDESSPTIAVTVDAQGSGNTAPSASDASISVAENGAYSGVLSADDPDGDALQYSIASSASKGVTAVTNTATGAFIYTPNPNATGSDSFSFKVNDGAVDSNVATISVTINNVNEQPQAANSSFVTNEGTSYSGQMTASDGDGDALVYSIVSGGSKGAVVINDTGTGMFTYSPNPGESGTDSFSFKVNDGVIDSNIAVVTVTISNENDTPQASDYSITIDEDTVFSGQLSAVDPDGDALQYSIVAGAAKGVATITDSATGAFTYTPDADASGNDSFSFMVNDGAVNSNNATVSVVITPVNDAPVAHNSSFNVEENTEYSGQLSGDDIDGDTLSYAIVNGAVKGVVTIVDPMAGTFVYTPNSNETGGDSFTFKVNDGSVDSTVASVTLAIADPDAVTVVFGDTPNADYSGTLADTYTNVNTDINAGLEILSSYSWSAAIPYKAANTIIIKADLSALPPYATVLSAELQLYQVGANGADDYSNSVHKIIGKDPVISQVNGYNAFNGDPWTAVPTGTTHNDIPLGLADIDIAEDTVVLDSLIGYRSWTITNMVQEWARDPSINFGLLIRGEETNAETGRTFASSENQSADIRPKLIIRYSTTLLPPQLIMIEELK